MENDIRIELVRDARIICELNQFVHQPHHLRRPKLFKPYCFQDLIDWYETTLRDPLTHSLVAYVNDQAIGYVLAFLRPKSPSPFMQEQATWLHIDQMGVRQEYQGKGIGKLLLEKTRTLGKDLGADRITLSVWEDNPEAIRFYEREGFGTFMRYMEKRIS